MNKRRLSSADTAAGSHARTNTSGDASRRPLYSMLSEDNVNTLANKRSGQPSEENTSNLTRLSRHEAASKTSNIDLAASSRIMGKQSSSTVKENGKRCDIELLGEAGPSRSAKPQDEDQVIPSWPSKGDAIDLSVGYTSSGFQHKVYSLKDYSQVSSPTATSASLSSYKSKNPSKSMSHPTRSSLAPPPTSKRQQQSTRTNNQPKGSQVSRHLTSGESRIDRMRKLLVAPLGIRLNSHHFVASRRLSGFQTNGSGRGPAPMLNSSHHQLIGRFRNSPRQQANQKSTPRHFAVYGCPLHLANNIYPITAFDSRRSDILKQQSVPYILARLCHYIEEKSSQLTHEGLFRVSGNVRLMERLRYLFDRLGDAPLELESVDVATSASLLKMYLRELPEPLIPTRMNCYFFALAKKYFPAASSSSSSGATSGQFSQQAGSSIYTSPDRDMMPSERQKVQAFSCDLSKLIKKLPPDNYNLLKYLTCFLFRVSLKQRYNKMCAEALGIVFGPNVFRIHGNSYKHLKEQELGNQIMAAIISNYQTIFHCELTDSLGNTVQPDQEKSSPSRLMNEGESSQGQGALTRLSINSMVSGNEAENPPIGLKPRTSNSPIASTSGLSVSMGDQSVETSSYSAGRICCAQKCRAAQHRLAYQCDNYFGDGHDSDDEEYEGESYSSGSASDSYCSSVDSRSVDTSYDDEGDEDGEAANVDERDDFDADDDDDGDIDMSSEVSSSICPGSRSSYSPSSSVTSEQAIEDRDQAISGEHQSLSKEDGDDRVSTSQGTKKSSGCLECIRRRQSIVNSNQAPEKIAQLESSAEVERKESKNELEVASAVRDAIEKVAGSQNLVSKEAHSGRQSNLMSRRSSSVSSLSQMRRRNGRHRHHNVTSSRPTHRRVVGGNQAESSMPSHRRRHIRNMYTAESQSGLKPASHHHRRSHHHRPSRSIRVRYSGSCCAASSGSKACRDRQQAKLQDRRLSTNSSDNQSTYQQLLSTLMGEQDLWEQVEFIAYPFSESQEEFPLRPYNSDEILFHSSAGYADFADQSDPLTVIPDKGRRYSGHDINGAVKRLNSLPFNFTSPMRERIFEAMDETGNSSVAIENLAKMTNDLVIEKSEKQASTLDIRLDETPRLKYLHGVSVVSLLDGRHWMELRRSQLSIDIPERDTLDLETCSDSISIQIKALKDLTRALRKALRSTITGGRSPKAQETGLMLLRLNSSDLTPSPDCHGRDQYDDVSICHVDYLAASSLAKRLEQQSSLMDSETSDEAGGMACREIQRIGREVELKVDHLRQTYKHLKHIRDHYAARHERSRQLGADRTGSEEQSKVDKRARSLDSKYRSERSITLKLMSNQTRSTPNLASKGLESLPCKQADCEFGPLCPIEFAYNIEKLLASKRVSGGRNELKLADMSLDQLQNEKLELQKNLLRYERWFGRPLTQDSSCNFLCHLYERYRIVKIMKLRRERQKVPAGYN